jgi:hypothetical protein
MHALANQIKLEMCNDMANKRRDGRRKQCFCMHMRAHLEFRCRCGNTLLRGGDLTAGAKRVWSRLLMLQLLSEYAQEHVGKVEAFQE